MKRIECRNHPKHAITNFCKNPNCYLPLCPECVVVHTAYHRERNLHGEFDTIENTLGFCESKLEDFDKRYSQLESTLFESITEIKKSEEQFQIKLESAKSTLIAAVEKAIESLKRDVSLIYKGVLDGMTRDFELMTKELKEKQREMGEMRRNLEIYPSKTIIELYSTMFVIDHHSFQSQVTAFNDHLKSQSLDFSLDSNTLNQLESLIRDNFVQINRKGQSHERGYRSPEPKIPQLRINEDWEKSLNKSWDRGNNINIGRGRGFFPGERAIRSPNYRVGRNGFEFGSPMRL